VTGGIGDGARGGGLMAIRLGAGDGLPRSRRRRTGAIWAIVCNQLEVVKLSPVSCVAAVWPPGLRSVTLIRITSSGASGCLP